MATLYMQTWCNACNKAGYISPRGPRHAGKAENGRQYALSGDVNVCDCYPPPVYEVDRTMAQTISKDDLARMTPDVARLSVWDSPEDAWHWIGFRLRDAGSCEGMRCAAYFADGSVETSVFDSNNVVTFDRPNGSECQRVELLPDDAQASRSVAESLISTILE
ncbi:PAAR domain-containing protein [Robbsia andropogonis]|uniref:hypothetical protein n=1 Tax=Robbsia andropogonis TaxID=28092 RepID=UPI0012F91704|nr:hypothetical protein [Robbsia andropogonis]